MTPIADWGHNGPNWWPKFKARWRRTLSGTINCNSAIKFFYGSGTHTHTHTHTHTLNGDPLALDDRPVCMRSDNV
ncbi:MAG: hypothetical protein KTM48_04000 [Wolbachia endosymbiont of Pissodes strobi]|nr:hypothetical protein [Wolbachia endosymbiont of Pissodes strobi]